jgi:hypothetical protein
MTPIRRFHLCSRSCFCTKSWGSPSRSSASPQPRSSSKCPRHTPGSQNTCRRSPSAAPGTRRFLPSIQSPSSTYRRKSGRPDRGHRLDLSSSERRLHCCHRVGRRSRFRRSQRWPPRPLCRGSHRDWICKQGRRCRSRFRSKSRPLCPPEPTFRQRWNHTLDQAPSLPP